MKKRQSGTHSARGIPRRAGRDRRGSGRREKDGMETRRGRSPPSAQLGGAGGIAPAAELRAAIWEQLCKVRRCALHLAQERIDVCPGRDLTGGGLQPIASPAISARHRFSKCCIKASLAGGGEQRPAPPRSCVKPRGHPCKKQQQHTGSVCSSCCLAPGVDGQLCVTRRTFNGYSCRQVSPAKKTVPGRAGGRVNHISSHAHKAGARCFCISKLVC